MSISRCLYNINMLMYDNMYLVINHAVQLEIVIEDNAGAYSLILDKPGEMDESSGDRWSRRTGH